MRKLAVTLFALSLMVILLAGCDESQSVRPVFDALSPGMTETQVENAVGAPDIREHDSWTWIDNDQHHEDVTITWGRDNRVAEVSLSNSSPGGNVKKRKPPLSPANAEKPKTAPEPPREPAQPVNATPTVAPVVAPAAAPAEPVKECRADCPTRTTACATSGCTCPSGCL